MMTFPEMIDPHRRKCGKWMLAMVCLAFMAVNQVHGQSRDALRQAFLDLKFGMFIHFNTATFHNIEHAKGTEDPRDFHPTKLDIGQWAQAARTAHMKYAVLTGKAGNGHCLWPSAHTDYTVANSPNQTDVVEKFVKACHKRGIIPGIYYNSMDNHHLFGSQTRNLSKRGFMASFPQNQDEDLPPYTTSVYQTFMTAQITELINNYGPIGEMWIDLPGELGRGYRTFIYHHIAKLQPDSITMMNSGTPDSSANYNVDYAWPSDLIAVERGLPPASGHQKWRKIEGKEFYVPAEICDPIGKHWYHRPPDPPRSDEVLLNILQSCNQRGANLLLNVPPSKEGVIPTEYVQALMRLRQQAKI